METEHNVDLIDFEDDIIQTYHKEEDLRKVKGNRGILMSLATLKAIANFVMIKLKEFRNKFKNSFQEIKDAEILEPYKQKETPEPSIQTITPDTPAIHERYESNPFIAAANASIERNSNEQSQLNNIIMPVTQEVPKLDEAVLAPQERETTEIYSEVSQPQIMPVYNQPMNENYAVNNTQQVDQTAAAITTYLNEAPVRREVVEQPVLQTPQEFQMPESKQVQDPYASVDIKVEGERAEINKKHNEFMQEIDMELKKIIGELNQFQQNVVNKSSKLSQDVNSRFDDISREIERARSSSRNNLAQIQSTQQEIINEYNGGMYNAR